MQKIDSLSGITRLQSTNYILNDVILINDPPEISKIFADRFSFVLSEEYYDINFGNIRNRK